MASAARRSADCVEYFDRLVVAYAPSVIIVYAGDNDLGDGGTPEQVLERLRAIVHRKRETLGPVPMAYVSIKISPARFALMHCIAYTNRIIERELQKRRRRLLRRYYPADGGAWSRPAARLLQRGSAAHEPRRLPRPRTFAGGVHRAVERDAGDLRVRRSTVKPAWWLQGHDHEDEAGHRRRAAVRRVRIILTRPRAKSLSE